MGSHPKKAKLLGCPDAGIAVDKNASTIGLLSDLAGLEESKPMACMSALIASEPLDLIVKRQCEGSA